MTDPWSRADTLYREERWSEAIDEYLGLLESNDTNHFTEACIASSYYELRDYGQAWRWIAKAADRCPTCPFVRWHLAAILRGVARLDESIGVYQGLISEGWEGLARGPCSEGGAAARQLVNDARIGLALTLVLSERRDEAIGHARSHLETRDKSSYGSVFRRDAVVAFINREEEHRVLGYYISPPPTEWSTLSPARHARMSE